MKKIIFKSIFILSITLLLSSCAAGLSGVMTSGSASLSSNNFTYIESNLQGTSQATYILGFGGMKRDAIVNEAKVKMLENTALKSNQAIANVTVDFKVSNILGIVKTIKCFVTAYIVEIKLLLLI